MIGDGAIMLISIALCIWLYEIICSDLVESDILMHFALCLLIFLCCSSFFIENDS